MRRVKFRRQPKTYYANFTDLTPDDVEEAKDADDIEFMEYGPWPSSYLREDDEEEWQNNLAIDYEPRSDSRDRKSVV